MISKSLHRLLVLCAAAALPAAALAQEDADRLIDASRQADSGLALAQSQAAQNDFPGALGTLERVLLADPDALPPRLLYAALLCRLDDRQGAELELGLLAGRPIADPDWAVVGAACGPIARPAQPRRKR